MAGDAAVLLRPGERGGQHRTEPGDAGRVGQFVPLGDDHLDEGGRVDDHPDEPRPERGEVGSAGGE